MSDELIAVPREAWNRLKAEVADLRAAVDEMRGAPAEEPDPLAAGFRRFRARLKGAANA